MKIFAILKIAGRALRRNKMRTVLTMLGIIIGVCAVIATVSIGNGAKAQVEAQIASLGQNVILIFSGSFTRGGVHSGWGGAGTLTIEDATSIQREVSGVVNVSPELRSAAQVAAGNQNWFTSLLGEGDEYLDIRQWPLAEGAMFTPQDVRSANKVAVIGKTTATQLFGSSSPVGQVIRIKNVPFVVVGELTPKGLSVMGSDQDDVLIVPYTSAMKRIMGVTTLRGITVQTASATDLASAQKEISDVLRQRHKISPGKDDDFTVRTQQEIAETATQTSKTMTLLLSAVALVSLIVGGIGVMNIMLVSVTERTREIGIRMAVGARGKDILVQFLIEATLLSSVGGAMGIGLGLSFPKIVAAIAEGFTKAGMPIEILSQIGNWPTLIPLFWIALAFLVSATVGILFGFYPAYKASRLNPIDALRYE